MQLRIFFLPFLAPGHMIPMVDMAKLFASRGVESIIVTTPGNVPRIQPSLDTCPHQIQLLTLPFPSSLPDNLTHFPKPNPTPEFQSALDDLKSPFEDLVDAHRPDCIVSDLMYPWSAHVAADRGIPRIYFTGTSSFTFVAVGAANSLKPLPEDRPFVLPGIPHRVEMFKSQLPEGASGEGDQISQMIEAHKKTLGVVMNSFHELEEGYDDILGDNAWLLGPVSLCDINGRAVRGGGGDGGRDFDNHLDWLQNKKPGSVLHVSFGSLSMFTNSQLGEIARGLILSGYQFIWAVRSVDTSDWMPEGIEQNGLIVRGWAPQMVILNHPSVGGFLTHCGWNSCLEGAGAGLPMVTWPLFAEQFFNERLLVDVVRIGVAVGSKVCTFEKEERTMVSGDEVSRAVKEVMGSGEEAEERRKRAKDVANKAKKAMEEGGSSYNDLSKLIQKLKEIKAGKIDPVTRDVNEDLARRRSDASNPTD